GLPVVKPPTIARLAAEGPLSLRPYAQGAPCGPSRASLYTGLYQMNHRVVRNGTPLDRRHDNIALAMARLGYRPTLFGYTDQAVDPREVSADSPWLRTYEGILPGFEARVHLPEYPEAWLRWLSWRGAEVPASHWELFVPPSGPTRRPGAAPPRYGADETPAAFLTGAFIDWLGEQDPGTPWFAHVSYIAPHPPFVVPEPYNRAYSPSSGPAFRRAPSRAAEGRVHPAVLYWLAQADGQHFVLGADPISGWDSRDFGTVRAVYWGMISEVDAQIGRAMDAIAAAGMADDTIVVFTSDHGEML
ncbi:MAG TPA: sulfatase-like hydrolase/transferase, partial [Bauldia sp.]|nr:sulfatase-like hydrolase/transferase [Bauldia sp.]